MEYVIRFLVGGLIVSAFAVLGDVLRPKSFAGLFGAAPSVALASLTLAFWRQGSSAASTESRSMILGAIAFLLFSRLRSPAVWAAGSTLVVWLVAAFTLKQLVIG